MENKPVNPESSIQREGKNAPATVFISLTIGALLFCFAIFRTPPSLAYILIVYLTFFMLTTAVLSILFVRSRLKLYAGIITVGSAIGSFAAVMNQDFYSKMLVGQIVTGVFVLLNAWLIVMVWKRQVHTNVK